MGMCSKQVLEADGSKIIQQHKSDNKHSVVWKSAHITPYKNIESDIYAAPSRQKAVSETVNISRYCFLP
jgi:hypothetical protein